MHEFALAQNIVKAIEENTGEDFQNLTAIHIEVGEFAGVVQDSLLFGLEVCLKDKQLENIQIHFTHVPGKALCSCQHQYELKDMFEACPKCHTYQRKIISGTDVLIKSVEVKDSPTH